MIPSALKDAWRRSRMMDEEEDEPIVLPVGDRYDPVLRYAMVAIAVILIVGCLQITRPIAVPLVAGIVFGLVLGPVVDRLMRLGIPQGAAAGLVVLAGVIFIATIIVVFAAPFAIWSDQLPNLLTALKARFAGLMQLVKDVEGAASELTPKTSGAPVVAVETGSPWINVALTSSAAAAGMLVFVATIYFYLATRRHLKARALRLCLGASARRTAGQFIENIESKLASYFAVVTMINLGMGLITALIAWSAGLPFAIFWGMLAFALNYIAFVGPIIMTGLLLGACLLDANNSWVALWPVAAYFVVHLVEGNVVTPLLVGRRLTVSPFLVFVSFVFWLWLWGPVGAILSVPLLLLITLSIDAAAQLREINAEAAPATPAAAVIITSATTVAATATAAASSETKPAELQPKPRIATERVTA